MLKAITILVVIVGTVHEMQAAVSMFASNYRLCRVFISVSAIIQLLSVVTLETDFIPCVFITALHNEHPRERQTVSGDCGDQRES